jgi:hypothetical protein
LLALLTLMCLLTLMRLLVRLLRRLAALRLAVLLALLRGVGAGRWHGAVVGKFGHPGRQVVVGCRRCGTRRRRALRCCLLRYSGPHLRTAIVPGSGCVVRCRGGLGRRCRMDWRVFPWRRFILCWRWRNGCGLRRRCRGILPRRRCARRRRFGCGRRRGRRWRRIDSWRRRSLRRQGRTAADGLLAGRRAGSFQCSLDCRACRTERRSGCMSLNRRLDRGRRRCGRRGSGWHRRGGKIAAGIRQVRCSQGGWRTHGCGRAERGRCRSSHRRGVKDGRC